MKESKKGVVRILKIGIATASLAISNQAFAQLTTSTISGNVTTAEGEVTDGDVTATNVASGFTVSVKIDASGDYILTGLAPGTYNIKASSGGSETIKQVTIQVGQTAKLDLAMAEGDADAAIVVVGHLTEVKTSEVATNVTTQQIRDLPQNSRNFLNFAGLAPGVKVNPNPNRQSFSGGGISADPNGEPLGSPQVNVFIDGVSLKSNINQGGLVGQDASRGNPFSQLAVQEFRVISQNFKAEYEDAGSTIITAVTKSGSNEFHGEVFALFQPTSFIERDFFQKRDGQKKVKQDRYQFGAALGGPIIQDKLNFFLSYEGNYQNRVNTVVPGTGPSAGQVPFDVDALAGSFGSPFREDVGFAKLNWQIDDNQRLELSGSIRNERETRDFGGQSALSRATRLKNDVYTANLKHFYTGDSFSNEATVDFLRFNLNFDALDQSSFGLNYDNVIRAGGAPGSQEVIQRGFTLRDNLTYTGLENHVFKIGGKISFQKYTVAGNGPNANPQFFFRIDPGQNLAFDVPDRVEFGIGNPLVTANNTQLGFFIQDDWEVTSRLTVNAGIRWDFESDARNKGFVTSPAAAEALRALDADPRTLALFNADDYIATGNNRSGDTGQFQPRIGFSYDINDDQRTVIFGGFGRNYDRALFRNAAEESLLRQFASATVFFTPSAGPRADGTPTVPFQESYLTPEGFAQFVASLSNPGSPGSNELRVIPNNLKSPRTDQFIVGVRQKLWGLQASLSYSHIDGRNQIGYFPANRSQVRNDAGFRDFIPLINGFGNVVAASNDRATKFNGVYFTLDKPYTESSGYGFGVNYTLSYSKERGYPFNFDHAIIAEEPFRPNSGDERHRLILNGTVKLPWDIKLSTLSTIASGVPYFVIDASRGFGDDRIILDNSGDTKTFIQVDMRLQKQVNLGGDHKVGVSFEVFNLFNRANFGSYDGFIPPTPEVNSNFGAPNGLAGPPRSFQLGVNYQF